MCRRRRGCAQSLCRQYKKSVGGQKGVRVCGCQRANTRLQNFYQHPATATAQAPPAQIKPFLARVKGGFEPAKALPPPHTFPLASNADSNRGSFGKARGHTETSPCLPHPYCGNKWCSAGWSSRMPLPTLLLSPWELSGPQRPKNTFLFSWGELCSVGGGRTCSRCGWC